MRKFLWLLLLMPAAAHAGTREDVYSSSLRCSGIRDDRNWLQCYYGAAQPMRQMLGLPPAPAAQVAAVPGQASSSPAPASLPPVPASAVKAKGGMFGGTLESNMAVTAFSFDRKGLFTVTLANGEIWRQLASDTAQAHWSKPAASYAVAVRQSPQGSIMEVQGDSVSYRVERLR